MLTIRKTQASIIRHTTFGKGYFRTRSVAETAVVIVDVFNSTVEFLTSGKVVEFLTSDKVVEVIG